MISIAQRINFNVLKRDWKLSISWACLPSPHLSPTTFALYLRNAICSVPHCMNLHMSHLSHFFHCSWTLTSNLFQTKSYSFFESRLRIINSRKSLLTGLEVCSHPRDLFYHGSYITMLMLFVLHVYFPLSLPKFGCLKNLFLAICPYFPFQSKFMPTFLCKHHRFLGQ